MRLIRFTPRFWFALTLIILVLLIAFVGPMIHRVSPNVQVGGLYDPPTGSEPLGTDNVGHDVLAQLMYGTRSSLAIGLVAGVIATLIGVVIGTLAGFVGGAAEEGLMGVTNIVISIPAIVVLILISIALNSRSLVTMAVVIGITSWPWTARAVRAQASSVSTREHIDVARLSGARTISLVMFDVLPYILSYVAMAFVLQGRCDPRRGRPVDARPRTVGVGKPGHCAALRARMGIGAYRRLVGVHPTDDHVDGDRIQPAAPAVQPRRGVQPAVAWRPCRAHSEGWSECADGSS